MIYLYDEAIVSDMMRSFNSDALGNPVVTIVDPENVMGIAAQIKDDAITFPIIAITRDSNVSIDTSRLNFTRLHKGVRSVINNRTNEIYYEQSMPINLSYKFTLLTTNVADMDELVREILFKYTSMYFLEIQLPYECNRKVRFGVVIDQDNAIERSSSSSEYIQSGQLHQTIVSLRCEGCVLVTYNKVKLQRMIHDSKDVETVEPYIDDVKEG